MADRNSSQFEPTVKFEPEQQRTVPYRRLEQQQTIQFDRSKLNPPPPRKRRNIRLLLGGLLLALGLIGLGFYMFLSGNDVVTEPVQPTNVPIVDNSVNSESTVDEDETLPSALSGILVEPNGILPSINVATADEFGIPAPNGTTFVSDIYTIERDGARDGVVQFEIPPGGGDIRTIDLVELTEDGWMVRPSVVRNGTVETEGELAPAFALVQSPQGFVSFAAERSPDTVLPNTLGELFGERSIGKFVVQDDGLLDDPVPSVPVDGLYYLHVVNGIDEVDENVTLSLIINPDVREAHIETLVDLADGKQYDGVHIDYQQIPDDMRDGFTQFLSELRDALDDEGLALIVSLGHPTLSAGLWDTAGQNWAEIGRVATIVFAEMPLDPTVYADSDEAEQFVQWATRQIDRRKLMLSYTVNGIDSSDGIFASVPNSALIQEFGALNGRIDDNDVIVRLNGSAKELAWDGFAVTYKFDWRDAGKTHTAWLANEAVLAYRMRLAEAYGVRGVTLYDLGDEQNTLSYRSALESVSGDVELPESSASAIIWSVAKLDGSLVASGTSEGDDPTQFTWLTEGRGGLYGITADFFIGDQAYLLGEYVVDLGEGNGTEFEALPNDTSENDTSEDDTSEDESDTSEEEVEPTETAVVNGTTVGRLNFRGAPSTGGSQITLLLPDTPLEVFGRSNDDLWYNVRVDLGDDDVREGWVWAEFVNVNRTQTALLPVTE